MEGSSLLEEGSLSRPRQNVTPVHWAQTLLGVYRVCVTGLKYFLNLPHNGSGRWTGRLEVIYPSFRSYILPLVL